MNSAVEGCLRKGFNEGITEPHGPTHKRLQVVRSGDRVLAQAIHVSESSIALRVLCVDDGLRLDATYGVIRYKDAGVSPGTALHTIARSGTYLICEVLTVSTPCILRPWPETL
ncbi:hypothetical protein GL50803_0031331 [Giardia duodenalis]|uniref:Uncharacterized protein n=1 Tax=Giardia intestinalis (strain ATCC 50803 / WB clone C6) TaxID=184922 RepID=A0A644F4I2_GIAIC|nr:hypothetical protein GL50803_0031331 [Giardia intestinalis]KAE8303536.1 hypothetical protein GL50803_0031331 [Giardia intestinalis]